MTQPRPLHPALLSTIQLAGTIRSVALAGGRILATGETGIYILRMATPETLAIENFVSLPAEVNSVARGRRFRLRCVRRLSSLIRYPLWRHPRSKKLYRAAHLRSVLGRRNGAEALPQKTGPPGGDRKSKQARWARRWSDSACLVVSHL
jgi:hypothetical protein